MTAMWNELDGVLSKTFKFAGFAEAFGFMTSVALIAQTMDHHPDMSIAYSRVSISMTTHDEGNTITDLDRRLAEAIDQLL